MGEEKKEETKETEVEPEKSEETKETEETKEDFTKEEVVPAGKYNQSIRKLREMELENRELKKLADTKPEKEEAEDEKEDIFEEEKLPDINHLIEEKVKPVLERLNRKEADDRKNQRDAFFTKHPEYLDAKRWNELLDEVDNSLNPNSNDNHYTQLEKAHRILSAEQGYSEIDKKKKELAADSASKGDGSNKPEGKKSTDEREDRLSRRMPRGYEFKN
jgi:hypothetical protein